MTDDSPNRRAGNGNAEDPGAETAPPPAPLVAAEASPLLGRDCLLLALIFLLALVIRVVYDLQMQANPLFANPILDGEVHDTWARAILAGERFFDGAYFKAPLYPGLLACIYRIAGPGYLAPRLVQAVIGAASCGLLFLVGRRAFGRLVGALAGLAAATYWVLVYFDGELLLEPLSIFLNLLALWLLLRAADGDGLPAWLPPGLVLGLSAINRPNVLVFMPVVAIWILLRCRRRFTTGLARAALFGAACLVPILPITIRNYVVGDDFVLIASQGGPNFYIGNNPEADGISARMPGARTSWGGGYQDWITLAETGSGRKLKPSEVSAFFFRRAWAFIRETPGLAANLTFAKAQMFFHHRELANNHDLYFFTQRYAPITRCLPLTTGLILPAGLLGLALSWRERRRLFPLWSFTLVYTATVIAFFVCARFRVPVMPLFILYAAYLLVRCADFVRRRDWVAIGGCALLVFLLWRGLHRDWPEDRLRREIARAHTQVATALAEAGRETEARRELLEALKVDPDSVEAHAALAYFSFRRQRYTDAIEHFRKTLLLNPGSDVHEYLARALIKRGRWGEAIDVLRTGTVNVPHYLNLKRMLAFILATCPDARHADGAEALRLAEEVRDFGPEVPETFDTLACAYARLGRFDEAIAAARRALRLSERSLNLEGLVQIKRHLEAFQRRRPFIQFQTIP